MKRIFTAKPRNAHLTLELVNHVIDSFDPLETSCFAHLYDPEKEEMLGIMTPAESQLYSYDKIKPMFYYDPETNYLS